MPDASRLRDRYAIAGIGLSRFGKLPGTNIPFPFFPNFARMGPIR